MPLPSIDAAYLRAQLERLLSIASPTGYTDTVVRHGCEELGRLGLPFSVTRRGAILRCIAVATSKARARSSRTSTRSARP